MRTTNGKNDCQRLEILHDYLCSSSSKLSIEKKYGLSHGTIRHWLRIFALPDKTAFEEMAKKSPAKQDVSSPEDITSLKLRIKQLESTLKEAEMARDAYDCMIDLAEDRYHIKVRKNSDAK